MSTRTFVITAKAFLVFILLSYAMVLSLLVDGNLRNYLVLLAALVGGILFLMLGLPLQRHMFWALILFTTLAMRGLFVGGSGELASVSLTCVYATGYFAIASLLERVDDKRTFIMGIMRRIIIAFAALSVLQMITSLVGFPVPNLLASKGLWSYNSFAFEPSQLGRVVGISMLCYLMLSRQPGPQEPMFTKQKLWVSFLVTMLLSGSALSAVAIIMVYALSRSTMWLIVIVGVIIFMWPMALQIGFVPLQRAVALAVNFATLDLALVLAADHSGGLRVASLLVYLRDASVLEPGFWFGYGSQGLTQFFLGEIAGAGDRIAAGFLPGFAVVYGVILMAAFVWLFAIRQFNRTTAPLIAFWLLFFINSAWNTQVFWYGLILIQIVWAVSRDNSRHLMQLSA